MKKMIAIAFGLLLVATPVLAQTPNPDAELAMHVISTDDYLYCDTEGSNWFCPVDCSGIDPDVSMAEIDATDGYGYIVFVIYNFNDATAVEFLWGPTARPFPSYEWCPVNGQAYGTPDDVGVAVAFGESIIPTLPCGGVYCFGMANINFADADYYGTTMCFLGSSYTTSPAICDKIAGPAPDYTAECLHSTHCGVIGGVSTDPFDDCNPEATAADATTWSGVKAMYR